MSATCPACGVAVVPGYVRCPKCQRPLPSRKVPSIAAGGTVVTGGGRVPVLPILGGAVVALGIILYFVVGRSDAAKPHEAAVTAQHALPEEPAEEPAETALSNTPPPVLNEPTDDDDRNRVDPHAVARDVERALRNQRLWSKVEVIGKDVDITSGSCHEPGMAATVDAARTALRNAGLTRVRCLENSGRVVFERAL